MRLAASLVALALGLLALPGCGATREESYCEALQADRKQFAEMLDSTSSAALLTNLPMLRDLAEKAPSDLVDEWQAFLTPIEGLDKALRDAGVEPAQFKDGKPPAGIPAADQRAIIDAADQLAGDDAVRGASGIDQQARDVCKINLGL